MSQTPSPFSEPAIDSSAPVKPGISTASIFAICLTMLLMCGGLLTFAYFAVDRLAETLDQIEYGDEFDDDETPVALEYALAENASVQQHVGEVELIEVHDELTYDIKGDEPEYYYKVRGELGEIVVAVWFNEEEESEAWFDRVASVTESGNVIEELEFRSIPFDSEMSKVVMEKLLESPELSAPLGEIEYVATNWDRVEQAGDELEILRFFDVRGSDQTAVVQVTFADYNYDQIESVSINEE